MTTTTHRPPTAADAESGVPGEEHDRRPELGGPTALRPVSVVVERERLRLSRSSDRRGVARLLAGAVPAIRSLGTEQAARDGLRYRPIAWTVIALVALAFYLPGRGEQAPDAQLTAPPATAPVAAPTPVSDPVADPGPPDPRPVTPAPVRLPDPIEPGPSDPATPGPPTTVPQPSPTPAASGPLAVGGFGWATRIPATPLPTDQVPDGAGPVANRLGAVDRITYLRLTGDGSLLRLDEDGDAAREALGPAAVAACPILDPDWEEGSGQSFDDAPAWDDSACVAGSEVGDTWTFDLSGFGDVADGAGVVLLPTVDAPPDFQIAFELT